MAKSKVKSTAEPETAERQTQPAVMPLRKNKYRPIPKFNGKCKNC